MRKIILLGLLQLAIHFKGICQDNILDIKVDQKSNICEQCKASLKQVRKTLEKFMLSYQQYSTMRNLNANNGEEVLQANESQQKFCALFIEGASVYNDLKEFPSDCSVKDYANFVSEHFISGIPYNKVFISAAYMRSMNYNEENGTYEFVLEVKKLLFSGINEKNKEKKYKDGKVHQLVFNINMAKDFQLAGTRISQITGSDLDRKKKVSTNCKLNFPDQVNNICVNFCWII